MKYYAVSHEDLKKLGVKDFSEYNGSQICIWWDRDTIVEKVREEHNCHGYESIKLTDEEIEKVVDGIFDSLSNIDCSDINNEIENIINHEIFNDIISPKIKKACLLKSFSVEKKIIYFRPPELLLKQLADLNVFPELYDKEDNRYKLDTSKHEDLFGCNISGDFDKLLYEIVNKSGGTGNVIKKLKDKYGDIETESDKAAKEIKRLLGE